MTDVSESSLWKICIEASDNNGFISPKKKVKAVIENANLDIFDLDVIRRAIQSFYAVEKKVPTIPKFLRKSRSDLIVQELLDSYKFCASLF